VPTRIKAAAAAESLYNRRMDFDVAIRLLTGGEEGIREWNRRVSAGDRLPSLRGVNLGDSDLADTGLEHAQLAGANLSGADLADARLSGADLRHTNLTEADLSDAEMICTDLTEADLRLADLSGADLGGASMPGADLRDAVLEGADLSNANLAGADLENADLEAACLHEASLVTANLRNACLREVDLSRARLTGANLSFADLTQADLSDADLRGADVSAALLARADLSRADLTGADLSRAMLLETNLDHARLDGCAIYGITAWQANLEGTAQANLRISHPEAPTVCADGLEFGQLLYHLLRDSLGPGKIRASVPDAGLILGHFPSERHSVLTAIREALRSYGRSPISLTYETAGLQQDTQTATALARLCRWMIVDLTDATRLASVVETVVNAVPIPWQPLACQTAPAPTLPPARSPSTSMLPLHSYASADDLASALTSTLLPAADARAAGGIDKK